MTSPPLLWPWPQCASSGHTFGHPISSCAAGYKMAVHDIIDPHLYDEDQGRRALFVGNNGFLG